ncbi:MAG: DUF2239 family protein [Coriobacteriia bacterium]|nr:DUF2239 family protein [Coriobacteriia bacterium]
MPTESLTVFAGSHAILTGERDAVAYALREMHAAGEQRAILVFDDTTGEQIDIDLREGSASGPPPSSEEPVQRRPGRPKLGVVAREVTLLPRHWEWLNAQPGGASVALRKLVEGARRENVDTDRARRSQEAAFRFMTAIAGNEPGFEEACRALYAGDRRVFNSHAASWPPDVGDYARRLAGDAFATASIVQA